MQLLSLNCAIYLSKLTGLPLWLHTTWLVCYFMRIWSQHCLCKHHEATKLLWKVNDEICYCDFAISTSNVLVEQWRLLFLWCHFEKKKNRKKQHRFTDKNKPRQLSYFCFVNSLLSMSVRVDRCTFISMFLRSYTHALYFSKCSTFANDKYIIAHITARHICESLL